MKTLIVTQDEPFYIPLLIKRLLLEYRDCIGIVLLPGIPHGFNMITYIKRLFDVFGFRDFLLYGSFFTYYKSLSLVPGSRVHSNSICGSARACSIPVYRLKNINAPESIEFIKQLRPQVIASIASPQIFKSKLISIPEYTINIHAALLPNYRGMMPSFWVLAKGEKQTGVTVHYIDRGIDTGRIILQRPIEITPQDTLHSLQIKVAQNGAAALLEALRMLEKSRVEGRDPFQENQGSYYSFPDKKSGREFRERGRRFIRFRNILGPAIEY